MKSGQWSFNRRVHAARIEPFSRPRHGGAFQPFSRRVHAARKICNLQSSICNLQSPLPRTQSRSVSKSPHPRIPESLIPNPSRRGFTLIELLVTITIIGILAAMSFGALQLARESARETATKATIAKLNTIVMRRYESYMTRRVPIQIPRNATPSEAAQFRLAAIREIMRMEMPERWSDIIDPSEDDEKTPNLVVAIPITVGSNTVNLYRPALSQIYAQHYINVKLNQPDITPDYSPAECLYMLVSLGMPEEMEQFHQSEIGDVDGDQMPEFIDGWGRPIMWLRYAPGFSTDGTNTYSDIQIADHINHHDPFDTRRVDGNAYHLIPLIYSAGANGRYGIELDENYHFMLQHDPFANQDIGRPTANEGSLSDYQDNITNHHIEQR